MDDVGTDTAARAGNALFLEEGRAAERAIEVEVVEPAVEAVLVEDVAAVEHADLVAVLQGAQAHHAIGNGVGVVVAVGEEAVEVELIGEDDEAGEAGADGGEKSVVRGRAVNSGEA